MQILCTARVCFLAAFLITGIIAEMGVHAAAQTNQSQEQRVLSETLQSSQLSDRGEQILADLVKHNEVRNEALHKYSAVRTYAVTDLRGKVHAKEIVRMDYVAPDKKTFVTIAEEGSGLVRRLVLNRLMESEASAATGEDHRDSSITPANYSFRLLGQEDLGRYHCFVLEVLPKRRDKFLFEGKIWIDSQDFAVVKIAGHPAKNLSFWISRADFIRQYEKIDGFWLPAKDETFVDVKFYGQKILRIEHRIDSVNGVTNAASAAEFDSRPLP
jgi:outer membrane lipoprotein-sorting protein